MVSLQIYALPNLTAVAIKLLIVFLGHRTIRRVNAWMWMFLIGLLIVNLCELALFLSMGNPRSAGTLVLLSFYYFAAVVSSASYWAVAMQLAGCLNRSTGIMLLGCISVGTAVLLAPDWALAGTETIGYAITRVLGPAYWVLQVVIVVPVIAALTTLSLVAFRGRDTVAKWRTGALLGGSAPAALSVVVVVALMQQGLPINATVVLSLVLNVLLGVLIYSEYKYRFLKLRILMPATREHQLARQAVRAAYQPDTHGLTSAIDRFEKAVVADAMSQCHGNKSAAAALLGISRATLRRKLDDHSEYVR